MVRFEHANLSVRNADKLVDFIRTALPDFRVRGSGTDGSGRKWCHVGTDDTYVALTTVAAGDPRAPYSDTPGLNHLGFEIDDLDALRQRMARAGFRPNLEVDDHPARRRIYFHDPEGNDWEFVEYRTNDVSQRNDYRR